MIKEYKKNKNYKQVSKVYLGLILFSLSTHTHHGLNGLRVRDK